MDQNSQNDVLINYSKTCLAYLNFNTIFKFLGQFATICIIFQKGVDVDKFETAHKTC